MRLKLDTLSNETCLTWSLHTTNVMFEVYLKYCWKVENWYWFLVHHWDLYPFHQFADQVKYLQFPKQMTIVYQTRNVFLKWATFANLHHSPKMKAIEGLGTIQQSLLISNQGQDDLIPFSILLSVRGKKNSHHEHMKHGITELVKKQKEYSPSIRGTRHHKISIDEKTGRKQRISSILSSFEAWTSRTCSCIRVCSTGVGWDGYEAKGKYSGQNP